MMHVTRAAIPVRTKNSPIRITILTKESEMLKWDISYPDTFRCRVDNTTFTIVRHESNNKYELFIRARIGDEFFDKKINTYFDTLQDASKESEMIYERMNRK